ncbi:MAG: DEAD/DEAH box helicase [Puniceicoccaceae bacterium]|nr:MAG: DEAD/DEAH box helicase [Puniceicoccaceae bacterium]
MQSGSPLCQLPSGSAPPMATPATPTSCAKSSKLTTAYSSSNQVSSTVETFETALTIPDLWQQKAVNLLRAGYDVIVDAPTGAGKTFIFEHLVERAFPGKAVFTVPTRALANDKLLEWRAKGWHVGIETGDLSYQADAPIIIATLETQKRALMTGRGPKLLVVDEYQMIGDPARGVNYELALAMAPPETQLLLLSGSVGNPREIEAWLRRCGRTVATVQHHERPVPLGEIHLDALPDLRSSSGIHGRWPRYIARALDARLGPILIFAPRRKAAENLARTLAAALPEPDALILTHEQKTIAGNDLTRTLKQRIAFHHSGMSYAQRAALVEPLAKNNQLKVIVATTGLAAGINFAMRSVLVLEREYRVAEAHRHLRPDELLQMFGRAGRRGLDDRGTVLFAGSTPRLSESKPLRLRREGNVDWPSLLTVIQNALDQGKQPLEASRELTARLFAQEPIRLGLDDFLNQRPGTTTQPSAKSASEQSLSGGIITEFQNSEGIWERKRAPLLFQLKDTWFREGDTWHPGLSSPKIVASLRIGTICKFNQAKERRYGLEAPLATFPQSPGEDRLPLTKWLRKALREQARNIGKVPNVPKLWTIEAIEQTIIPQLPHLTRGGQAINIGERNGTLYAQLDYATGQIYAFKDLHGKGLLNPKERKRQVHGTLPSAKSPNPQLAQPRTVAEQWFALGLIDESAHPTRRGQIFSYFNHGEGLAIAAALEAENYPIEELIYDLANLRAGHRFNALALGGRPLTAFCQEAYGMRTIPGYLRRGLPEDYGEGASEILYNIEHKSSRTDAYIDDELSHGDIERAGIEWRSLRLHIAHAPDYDWSRWRELKAACQESVKHEPTTLPFENLPPLTRQQKSSQIRIP